MAERVEEGSEVAAAGDGEGDGEGEEDGRVLLLSSRLGLVLGEGRMEREGMKGRSWWAIWEGKYMFARGESDVMLGGEGEGAWRSARVRRFWDAWEACMEAVGGRGGSGDAVGWRREESEKESGNPTSPPPRSGEDGGS